MHLVAKMNRKKRRDQDTIPQPQCTQLYCVLCKPYALQNQIKLFMKSLQSGVKIDYHNAKLSQGPEDCR